MGKMRDSSTKITEKNRSVILDSAVRAFAKNGYKGTSIKQIADDAGLPKTNILYYFGSKEELYNEMLKDILHVWNSTFDQATAEQDPAEVLANYIAEKIEISRTHPFSSKVFALEILHGATALNDMFLQEHRAWMKGRVALIDAWIAHGKIRCVSAEHLLYNIWACTQHYADFSAQISGLKGRKMLKQDFELAAINLINIILPGCGLSVPEKYRSR